MFASNLVLFPFQQKKVVQLQKVVNRLQKVRHVSERLPGLVLDVLA